MQRKGLDPLLAAVLLLATPAVWAGNGHNLHGIGAVNSSMGGAGVALPIDTLGGLLLNPALAVGMEGSHFAFSAEYNQAKNAVESTVTVPTPGGPIKISGRTNEAGDRSLIPAFGFVHHDRGSNFAYGIGFLGLAGFGADYPQDPTNPILAPQPRGFGRVYSNYQLLKVPTVLSWQLSDTFSFGLSLNAAYATLTANPAGFATPDCSGPAGPCFVPSVNADSARGYGAGRGTSYNLPPHRDPGHLQDPLHGRHRPPGERRHDPGRGLLPRPGEHDHRPHLQPHRPGPRRLGDHPDGDGFGGGDVQLRVGAVGGTPSGTVGAQ